MATAHWQHIKDSNGRALVQHFLKYLVAFLNITVEALKDILLSASQSLTSDAVMWFMKERHILEWLLFLYSATQQGLLKSGPLVNHIRLVMHLEGFASTRSVRKHNRCTLMKFCPNAHMNLCWQ